MKIFLCLNVVFSLQLEIILLANQSSYIKCLEKSIYIQEETNYRMLERGAISNYKIRELNELVVESKEIIKIAMENMSNFSTDEFLRIERKENISVKTIKGKNLGPKKKYLFDYL